MCLKNIIESPRHNLLIFTVVVFLFCSCSRKHSTKNGVLLRQAEEMLMQYPDSALRSLQAIEHPKELSEAEYANYLLLQVQAHDKTGINIKEDTLMHIPAKFYSKKKDYFKAAQSYLYAGRVSLAQGNNEAAIMSLVYAKDYAEIVDSTRLLGTIYYNIGHTYSSIANYEKALSRFKMTQTYYTQSGNERGAILVQDHIGNMVWLLDQPDSAIYYFQQVLDYAEENRHDWYIGRMHRRLSSVHWDLEQYDKAKHHALISMYLDKKGDDAIFNYSTLARCYLQEGKIDSASYYVEKIRETTHGDAPEALLIYYDLSSQVLEKRSNYSAALKDAKEVIKLQSSITKEKRNSPIPYILEQHEKERIENEYNLILIHRLRLVITVIVIVLLGVLAAWFLMHRIKRRENELLEARQTLNTFRDMLNQKNEQLQTFDHELSERDAQLSQQAEQLLDYNRVLSEHNKKSEQLRSFLMDKLDIARKVTQMNVVTTNNTNEFMRQFQKVFGQNVMDWKNIYPVINDLYDGFVDKIKVAYPNLTEKELQLCCFIRSGFRSDEQAVLLDYTQSSIRVKRTQLVKKMGFDNAEAFLSYLIEV
jgi:tetratricopeptide (TPR) repeat protein/DNA-binding CsgD family transcriptional regulator